MRPRVTRSVRLAVALSALSALVATAATPAANASHVQGVDATQWVSLTYPHPANQDNYLYDVWVAGEEAWSVGVRRAFVGGVYEFRTWAQRCIGNVCADTYPRDYESPPNTSNALQSVSGTSSSDVWAVGYARIDGVTAATTHHFDGTSWTAVPNPITNGALYGVSAIAADDVWAVGAAGSFAPQDQVVLHWDGTAWTQVAFDLQGGCDPYDYLRDVAADGPRVLAIGECRVGSAQPEPMIASYRNGVWTRQPVAGIPPSAELSSVSWVGRRAWVAGTSTVGGGGDTYTAQWTNGTGWSTVSTNGIDGSLNGIAGSSAHDVWAVGSSGCCYRLGLHYDGTTWTKRNLGKYGFLEGIAYSDSGVKWAVGQKLGQSLILRNDP